MKAAGNVLPAPELIKNVLHIHHFHYFFFKKKVLKVIDCDVIV